MRMIIKKIEHELVNAVQATSSPRREGGCAELFKKSLINELAEALNV